MRGRIARIGALLGASLVASVAGAQDGAPLIDGLGGPVGLGEPHDDFDALDLQPAFPGGITYYADEPEPRMYFNWRGSVSFEYGDARSIDTIPQRLNAAGFSFRRIVPFHHSAELTDFQRGEVDPTIAYYANVPPDPEAGTPGRFIGTWYRVPNRGPALATYNSWQVILTAGPDPANFDVEFRYHACHWAHGIDRDDQQAVMGFDGGLGPDGPGWMWPGSLTDDVLLLCGLSNVREPGVFRYRVVDGVPTGCGIGAPPAGAGRCDDGNHLPGDGCSPACYVEPDADGDGQTEAPHPDAVDPLGVYDLCADPDDQACDGDVDGDGIPPHLDNCVDVNNPDQRDYNGDGVGDACALDPDDDTLPTVAIPEVQNRPADLCPLIYSRGTRPVDPIPPPFVQQPDMDRDGVGDACDPDDDGDGVLDCGGDGVCHPDDDGYNNDRDHLTDEGGECDEGSSCHHGGRDFFDNDADGVVDEAHERSFDFVVWPGRDQAPSLPEDNCRRIPNADQRDLDGDGVGDACDPDIDGDGVANCAGNGICGPLADGRDNDRDGAIDERRECAEGCGDEPDLIDQDLDGFVDEDRERLQAMEDDARLPATLDNCPRVASDNRADWDGDGVGDVCDDSDGDGEVDAVDNCRAQANGDQADADGDGVGDACDDDRDGDGIDNDRDGCPDAPDEGYDSDGDGRDNACDEDDDDDGINDPFDGCPQIYDPGQEDLDGDALGDVCDPDVDGDGIGNAGDACPRVADGPIDTDGDGVGDRCDADDDDDGVRDDAPDVCPRVADPDQRDLDGDGLGGACDPRDDRPFEARTPEEKCAILIDDRAPTAERLRHCPPPTDAGCSTAPGSPTPSGWWLLALLGLGRRRSGPPGEAAPAGPVA